MKDLTAEIMKKGFHTLNKKLPKRVSLLIGGGGAMLLAHKFPLATSDVDAIPKGLSMEELKPYCEEVAKELGIAPDWLNPWFSSFTFVLPADYESRLIKIFDEKNLTAFALGAEDLLLMKCFAHRKKDIAHARALVRAKADTDFVSKQIESLKKKKVPGAQEALDFLDEILDLENA